MHNRTLPTPPTIRLIKDQFHETATLWAGVLFLVVTFWAFAVSFDRNITTDYVKSHPKEFTVSVTAKANGLLAFTVVFLTPEPRYVVAHLVVRDAERAYAESHTPLFTRNRSNTFHFSVPQNHTLQLRRFHLASPASRTLVEKLFLSREPSSTNSNCWTLFPRNCDNRSGVHMAAGDVRRVWFPEML